jgi:membrane fusion protein, heavy metal efflux system
MNAATAPTAEQPNRSRPDEEMDHEMEHAARARLKMGWGQRAVVALLLTVVIVPSVAGIYSYVSGVPLHLLAGKKQETESEAEDELTSYKLVPDKPHTVGLTDEVAKSLGITRGDRESIAIAQPPAQMRPLVLFGSTAFDPARLYRVRARFAPCKVIEIAQRWDRDPKTGRTEFRELRGGDHVTKGELLGIFHSVDVGSKKNDLLQGLVQLQLDQQILDKAEAHQFAVPDVLLLTQRRLVWGDRTEINRALNTLKTYDIPQDEIDALHAEAKKMSANKDAWSHTPEGRWVKGENLAKEAKNGIIHEKDDLWGRVSLRSPSDGIIVERNVTVDEMVVDNTINLFQIADVSRLLVKVFCPEDELPALESLRSDQRRWTVQTVGTTSAAGLSGTIDEVAFIIDPNQHTAVIKGYVENPNQQIRAGQFVTATVNIPPPDDVVEIPVNALYEDGLQSLVFVQPDPTKREYTMRRVQVTHRFDRSVFIRKTPLAAETQRTPEEADAGLLPKEPLQPGDRVLVAATVELKRVVIDLESRPNHSAANSVASAKKPMATDIAPRSETTQKAGKG